MQTYISTNIKYLRTQKKMTQQQLAKVVGKGYTAVGNWETGIREPYAIDLSNLANFFNVSIDDLIKKDMRLNDNQKNTN